MLGSFPGACANNRAQNFYRPEIASSLTLLKKIHCRERGSDAEAGNGLHRG